MRYFQRPLDFSIAFTYKNVYKIEFTIKNVHYIPGVPFEIMKLVCVSDETGNVSNL